MDKVEIATRDGICPAYAHTPDGEGSWPAVLMFMDGPGIRPAMQAVAARLAQAGFYVLLPDLFYRSSPYPPVDVRLVWSDPKLRDHHRDKFMAPTTPDRVMSDTAAFLDFLSRQPQISPGPVGVVGYCMGGRLALIAAGTYPDRVDAVASYHGGGLATDGPSSPHLLAPKIKARVYVAGAIEDANFTDAQKAKLNLALTEAGVRHRVETYPAKHGWVLSDMPMHDVDEAEHHWRTLVPLMREALGA